MTYLRNSLIPGLLNAVLINERRQRSRFKLMEIGQIHRKIDSKDTFSEEFPAFGFLWYDIWILKGIEVYILRSTRDLDDKKYPQNRDAQLANGRS